MRALVTGSQGFLGKHFVRELQARGYQVMDSDIRDGGRYSDALKVFDTEWHFDLIVHCASHIGGRAGIDGQNMNFAKNLQLDAKMFEFAQRTGAGRVLYFSSSAVYPASWQMKDRIEEAWIDSTFDGRLLSEDSLELHHPDYLPQPDANYGFSKLIGERLAEDARKNGLAVSVVRPFSGASATQSLDYPFPSIVARARKGDMTVWGNPDQTRDWLDVTDVVSGALAVVDSGTSDPINLCMGRGVSMRQLATMIYERANPGQIAPEVISVPGPEGVFYRVGDPQRFFQYYQPRKTLEDMIDEALLHVPGDTGSHTL